MCAFNVSRPMPDGRRGLPVPARRGAYFQPVAARSRCSNMGIMV